MRRSVRWLGVGLLVALAAAAMGQPRDGASGPVRYDGHKVVRVVAEDWGQVETIDGLGLLWGESYRIGQNEVLVSPEALDRLRDMGFEPEVLIDDAQALFDAEMAEIEARRMILDPNWYTNFKTLDEVMARVAQIAAEHPDLVTNSVIGQSIQGRDIVAMEITAPGDRSLRPVIFFNGTQHSREWISPMAVVYIVDRLTSEYGSEPRVTDLLERVVFKVVPVVNPDGYLFSWTDNRMWRKNRRNNGNGTWGVDLNRNWDVNWGGAGSSGNTNSDIYRGTAPFSEPETATLRDYVLADPNIVAHIDFHSYSQLILWPWGYGAVLPPEPDRTFFDTFSRELSAVIEGVHGVYYTPQQAVHLYEASGIASDWTYLMGIKGWTFELRPRTQGGGGFVLPPEEIIPTSEENYEAALYLAERFNSPILVTRLDAGDVEGIAGQPTPVTVLVEELTESVEPDSATLFVRFEVASVFSPHVMEPDADGTYTGTIPSVSCGRTFEYYVEVRGQSGSVYRFPQAGALAGSITSYTTLMFDDCEVDTGWTVGAPDDTAYLGIWELADPEWTPAQPGEDHTPWGTHCWVTDGRAGNRIGDYDVDGGGTTLTSPIWDATEPADWQSAEAWISYHRWYSNDKGANPNTDHFPIRISNDGGDTWVMVEDVTENANAWVRKDWRISDFVAPNDQIRMHFNARDDDPGSIVEACIDDVEIYIKGCRFAPADLNEDGTVDSGDFFAFLDWFSTGDMRADLDANGVLDASDFFAFLDLFVGN